jgi:hypothetical protein
MTSTMRFDKWENSLGQPYGTVLQVVSVTKVDPFTTASTAFIDVTGLTASITPTSASSKILVLSKVAINTRSLSLGDIRLLRDATVIGGGTASGNKPSASTSFYSGTTSGAFATSELSVNFLDSPASVATQTYKIQTRAQTGTLGINTVADDSDVAVVARTSSTITLMEIAQ